MTDINKQLKWLRILRASSLYVLATGLLPSLAVFEVSEGPWRLFFDILTWPLDGSPASFTPGERQLSAVLGGVLCGWAWLLHQLAKPEVFNPRIRTFMIQSTWVWFILDSVGSVVAGIPLNAVSNVTFLLILLIPLRALK